MAQAFGNFVMLIGALLMLLAFVSAKRIYLDD